jgi:hypothetical protein
MVKKEGSEEDKKDLLPKYYVKSGLLNLFLAAILDVKPTGSVEMDLGARFTKQDNLLFTKEQI